MDSTETPPRERNLIRLLGGDYYNAGQLRQQIYDPVRAALQPDTRYEDAPRESGMRDNALTVSLWPGNYGEVLMMYDLADRNHFSQKAKDGKPHARHFERIMVAGPWMARKLLRNKDLDLLQEQVIVTGSPRIDTLLKLRAARPAPAPLEGRKPKVLFAPLHNNWSTRDGQVMSSTEDMRPLLPQLAEICDLVLERDPRNTAEKFAITEALLDVDIVITDYTSVMYEAWALGKPVIFPHWICAERIEAKAPGSAEAHVYREGIGHHPESLAEMCKLISDAARLDLGPGVEHFLPDYLSFTDAPRSGAIVANALEHLATPGVIDLENARHRRLEAAMEARNWVEAEALVSEALTRLPDSATLHSLRARIFNKQGKWWQEATALTKSIELNPSHGEEFFRLGMARQRMALHHAAAEAYAGAIARTPKKADWTWYYRLGYVLETDGADGPGRPGDPQAKAAYARAVARHPDKDAQALGLGYLHASQGNWEEAIAPYAELVRENPGSGRYRYRLGMAYERCYNWELAEDCYAAAAALAPTFAPYHMRLGFVRERRGDFQSAAETYLAAAKLLKGAKREQAQFRAGYVLEKAGQPEAACAAYAQCHAADKDAPPLLSAYQRDTRNRPVELFTPQVAADPENPALCLALASALEATGQVDAALEQATRAVRLSDPPSARALDMRDRLALLRRRRVQQEDQVAVNTSDLGEWRKLGAMLTELGDYAGAAEAFEQVVLRNNEVSRKDFNMLGRALAASGAFDRACEAFRQQYVLQRPHGIYEDRLAEGGQFAEIATYREFHDVLPIRPKTVLYESFSGNSMACSPLAIFEHILDHPDYAGWTHIWVLNDLERAPVALRRRRDVIFVTRDSQLYLRYLATAEHLVNNATFPYYYVRREGQKYLNTWHGTPLKALGIDIKDHPLARANTVRNFLHASHLLHPNEHTRHVMIDRNKAARTISARQEITGYPRVDFVTRTSEAEKARLKAGLGLDPTQPVVLFAPTYRGYWDSPEIETEALLEVLGQLEDHCPQLLFRGHYFAEQKITELGLPVRLAPSAIDSCKLLSIVDVLITDYSSIYFDFLPTGRPILHLVDDWDTYAEVRGVYFGKDELPGAVCETVPALIDAVDQALATPEALVGPRYRAAQEMFVAHEDGRSTERAVAFFFGTSAEPQRPVGDKRLVMSYVGAVDKNGITSSAFSALKGLASRGIETSALVDRRFVANDPAKIDRMIDLAETSDVIIRTGRTTNNPEEAWISDKFNSIHRFYAPEMAEIYHQSTRHEMFRVLGHSQIDCIVDYDGYSPYLTHLISSAKVPFRAGVLHNDMEAERAARFPHLRKSFDIYHRFDRLISVSDSIHEVNMGFFTREFGLDTARFRAVSNCLNLEAIHAGAAAVPQEDADYDRLLADRRYRIVNVARLSPEKNQARLITAVDQLVKAGQDVALYILGKGPLLAPLQALVAELGLEERVFFLGVKENPYPFIQAADCHVLSSDYEGQGIVLLEAMVLGTPSVSTDIPGPASVLAEGRGRLVALSPEALAEGILEVRSGTFRPAPFDAEGYNRASIDALLGALGMAEGG